MREKEIRIRTSVPVRIDIIIDKDNEKMCHEECMYRYFISKKSDPWFDMAMCLFGRLKFVDEMKENTFRHKNCLASKKIR